MGILLCYSGQNLGGIQGPLKGITMAGGSMGSGGQGQIGVTLCTTAETAKKSITKKI